MHSFSLTDTWVLHGPSTFQRTLSRSLARSHTHAFRHLRLQVWTLWRMCRQCTQAHKLCFATSATATMLENYFWTSNRLSPDTSAPPLPPCHLVCPSPFLSLSSLPLYCSPFFSPFLSLLKKSLNTRETTSTRKTRVGRCSPFSSAPLLSLAFGSVK